MERQNGNMRVLVVEDDQSVADGILDGLSGTTFDTRHVTTGENALKELTSFEPEIVLLDLGLPDMDGTEVCRRMRAISGVPIIVVSARDEEIDRVVALEIGADDYVVKPFGMRELVARIGAVTRRTQPEEAQTAPESNRVFGPLRIDLRAQRVYLNDEEIHLTPKEFELVEYLSSDPGAVFKRSDILHDVWDTNWYGTSKTLDAHIAAIRKKFGHAGWIESVRGVGFRFEQPQ
ncbi:DNA-binding response OmpR family regulator [Aurantimicrobium minutum]|nr:DNA-binding response OmpR family regulator [Aurantimicrobium minutum]